MKELFYIQHWENVLTDPVMDFVKTWHYSKSCRSMLQKEIYTLHDSITHDIVGVAIFGIPVSRHQNDGYTLELRRFCLIDNTPKNSESFFLGACIRELKRLNKYAKIVTFADPNFGHEGVIYKATNFRYDGKSKEGNPTVFIYNGEKYHKREVYQKRKGEYTPTAKRIQKALKAGKAKSVRMEAKNRYIMDLKKVA